MKPRWYRGWPLKPFLGVISFVALIVIISTMALTWLFKTAYFEDRPLFKSDLKAEEITSITLVYLANSQELDRLGLYAILDSKDYAAVVLELNNIDYRIESPLKKDITDSRCFRVETTQGETWLLCERGYFIMSQDSLSTGILRTPENWSAFDSLWQMCIENWIDP